jgi:hypothetical protein
MRAFRRRAFVPVAAVAASTVLLACHRGDSILLVEVAGDLCLRPASFEVAVEPSQAAQRTFRVTPPNGGTVTLPTSLSIEMAPNLTGPVMVTVDAFDENGLSVGYGSATQTDINVGGETIVVVTLTSSSPCSLDGGTDAPSGTGGSGVDASGAGAVAGSGASGSGGAAGSGLGGRGGGSGAGGITGSGGATGSGGKGGSTGTGGVAGAGGKGGASGASGTGGGAAGTTGKGGASGAGGSAAGTTGAGGAAGGPTDAGGDK